MLETGRVSAEIWENIINRIVPSFSEGTSNTTFDKAGEGLEHFESNYYDPTVPSAKRRTLRPPRITDNVRCMQRVAYNRANRI